MAKTFKQALDEELMRHPELGNYINICRVLQESGASRNECIKLFNKYMPDSEYDDSEKKELIDYLVNISKVIIPE